MEPANNSSVLEDFLRRQGFCHAAGTATNSDASARPTPPAAPPSRTKRRRVGDGTTADGSAASAAAGCAADQSSCCVGTADVHDDDDDDDLIVVGVSTAADRANAARLGAIDLASDRSDSTPHRDTERHRETQRDTCTDKPAAAAAPEGADAPREVAITERVLAERIQQLACSKNFADMSINDIRQKVSRMLGQDLTAHRKTIKRLVKTYAGIT